jgi:hypothetical protein
MIGVAVLAIGPAGPTADVVTLKDGTVVRGQVADPDDRGKLVMIVRRAWAEAEVPDRAKAWRAAEAPWMKRARAERLERLRAWRRDRGAAAPADADDPTLRWLDRRVAALESLGDDEGLPPLMMAAIDRREVREVRRQPPGAARLLRLGWRAGFADVEAMPADDLREALRGRGFDVSGKDPVSLAEKLPMPIEAEARWIARRAATEIALDDTGARFVRHGNFVAPEGGAGQAMDLDGLLTGMLGSALGGDLGALGLGDLSGLGLDLGGLVLGGAGAGAPRAPAADPLEARLRAVAAQGRVGAVLTRLEIAPDLAGVQVRATLLARVGPEDWRPVAAGSASVRTDELPPDAGANIAADPQVRAVFDVADQLGLGVSPRMKQRALAVGTATQAALGRARSALQADLEGLKLEE